MRATEQHAKTDQARQRVRMVVVARVTALGLDVELVGEVLLDAAAPDPTAVVAVVVIVAGRGGAADVDRRRRPGPARNGTNSLRCSLRT